EWNLDQVFEEIARGCSLNVIADGYLRPPLLFRANTEVREYPLETLLTKLLRPWRCQWRFLDVEKTTLLVRAENWWMEDAQDVPEPTVEEFRKSLGPDGFPKLDDLLRLAELS